MNHIDLSRRQILRLLNVGGVASIAGCSGGGENGGEDGNRDGSDGETPAELQDSVTISLGYEPNVVDDFWLGLYGIIPYFTNVLEPLTFTTQELRPKPWLATDWERTSDTTWTFTLRDGVTFHNGKGMTAEAVKFSIGELFKEFESAKGFTQLEGPESVEVIDDRTVEFTTFEPIGNYPAHIAHNMIAIQHPDADTKEAKPIGTGPYRMADLKESQQVTVQKFTNYWGEEDPQISEIVFQVIGDANTRFLSLKKHEIDIAFEPPHHKVESLQTDDTTNVLQQDQPRTALFGINIYKEPTDDVRLRRALNYAVSQKQLVQEILAGIGKPARGLIPPSIYWSAHDDLPEYGPDRDKAEQLVEESDYDGEVLSLVVTPGAEAGDLIAQTLQGWFDDIGVKTEIQVLESGTAWLKWQNGHTHLDLSKSGLFSAAADYLLYGAYHSEGQANQRLSEQEGMGLMNPGGKVDRLIVEGRDASTKEVKKKKYYKVQQIAMDQAVIIPLYYVEYVVGTYKDVSNLDLHPIQQWTRWAPLKHHKR